MIDPKHITDFEASEPKLQELLLFWIAVAGKTAKTISPAMEKFLKQIRKDTGCRLPFEGIRRYNKKQLAARLKKCGIGCQTLKARAFFETVRSGLDLKTCSARDLEKIYGIKYKTSRCFIMHSRRDANCAGLDTHVLAFLRDLGYNVPRSTPSSEKKYEAIGQQFLNIAKAVNRPVAIFDLLVWRVYSEHKHLKPLLLCAVLKDLFPVA